MYKSLRILSPWAEYYKKLQALFGNDPEIKMTFDESNYIITLHVNNADKAEAIQKLLPTSVTFGNVTLNITVVPANHDADDVLKVYEIAFKNNPVLSYTKTVPMPAGGEIKYAVFAKEVVQYYNDDLSDVCGNKSTLYQYIADDILENGDEVRHCTSPLTQYLHFPHRSGQEYNIHQFERDEE